MIHPLQILDSLKPFQPVDVMAHRKALAQLDDAQNQSLLDQQKIAAGNTAAQEQAGTLAKQKQIEDVLKNGIGPDGMPTNEAFAKINAIDAAHGAAMMKAFGKDPNTISEIAGRANLSVDRDLQRTETARHNLATETNASDKQSQADAAALRKLGAKRDVDGSIIPLDASELTLQEQQKIKDSESLSEARAAQSDLAAARAEAVRNPGPTAAAKLQQAQQRLDIASQRLGLSQAQYNSRSLGVDAGGAPLPGAMLTDSGQTIGSSFSQNVRPTGQERNKADMAGSAHEQIADIRSIVQRRPDIFGPGAGRVTDIENWIGSEDPDAKRYVSARTIAGDHLAGTFGGRSEAALTALDNAIGQFKDNPAAALAGLDQIDKANDRFIKAGTVNAVGQGKNQTAPAAGKPLIVPGGALEKLLNKK